MSGFRYGDEDRRAIRRLVRPHLRQDGDADRVVLALERAAEFCIKSRDEKHRTAEQARRRRSDLERLVGAITRSRERMGADSRAVADEVLDIHGVSLGDVVGTLSTAAQSQAARKTKNDSAVYFTKLSMLIWEKHTGRTLPPKRMTKGNPFYPFLRAAMPVEVRPPRGGTEDVMFEVTGILRRAQEENRRARFRTRFDV